MSAFTKALNYDEKPVIIWNKALAFCSKMHSHPIWSIIADEAIDELDRKSQEISLEIIKRMKIYDALCFAALINVDRYCIILVNYEINISCENYMKVEFINFESPVEDKISFLTKIWEYQRSGA
jgi:hypothetical protein